MRTLLIAFIAAACAIPAEAETRKPPKPATQPPAKQLSLSRSHRNPCADFGPGFVQLEGSSTCVRLGGGISVGGGIAR